MVPCTFRRLVAKIDGPDVLFSHSETIKTILIAEDWQEGWEKSLRKEDYSKSGYVGQGMSKCVIYAWFGNVEYALGQLHDNQSSEENACVLQVEYENLVQGEAFREGFEELALEYSTSLPKFRFNLTDAILGHFVDDSEIIEPPPEAPCGLPYWDFIATRLLPCGPIDAPIEKFTGNNDVGPAPGHKEHLMVALHAFTHYVAIWSRGKFLLCMYDKTGTMCLINPQSHSHDSSNQMNHVYWDGGPKAIERFIVHHLKECQNNVICNALQLRTVEFEDSDGDEQSTSNRFKSVSPKRHSTHSQDHCGSAKLNPLRIGV
ncbi:hypothetical protein BYT27DRAFT_7088937 [Phlegmacium glaucopus]|nr:hypothetical protein BYT27DRAFT_7088937 [Phlegmacium glaucopus]